MNQKRSFDEVDADYQEFDHLTEHQTKRQKLIEHDAKEATRKRIEAIIRREFSRELCNKETEIELIDERIHEGRRLLDRLRACIVAQRYSSFIPNADLFASHQLAAVHPAVKKLFGKAANSTSSFGSLAELESLRNGRTLSSGSRSQSKQVDKKTPSKTQLKMNSQSGEQCRGDRFKVIKKIIVGNVSKYLAPDTKEENDRSTHKWMVYVRTPKDEPPIEEFVEKVCFFLHPSYYPNDIVEVVQPPFRLIRRGWGEFPVQVRLHCKLPNQKIFNIGHQLKLDRTYTGLQTMGAETVVEIKLDKELNESFVGRFKTLPGDSPRLDDLDKSFPVFPVFHIKEEKDDEEHENMAEEVFEGEIVGETEAVGTSLHIAESCRLEPFVERTDPGVAVENETECFPFSNVEVDCDSSTIQMVSRETSSDLINPSFSESPKVVNDKVILDDHLLSVEKQQSLLKAPPPDDEFSFPSKNLVDAVISKPVTCGDVTKVPMTHGLEPTTCDEVSVAILSCDGSMRSEQNDGNVHEEMVIEGALESASGETICIEEALVETVCVESLLSDNNVCSMEQERSDNIQEEMVVDDAVYIEPDPGVDISVLTDSSVVEKRVIEQGVPTSVPNSDEVPVKSSPNSSSTSSVLAKEGMEASRKTENHGLLRCIDASGRVFAIPRHFVKALPKVTKPISEVTPTKATAKVDSSCSVAAATPTGVTRRLVGITQMNTSQVSSLNQITRTNQVRLVAPGNQLVSGQVVTVTNPESYSLVPTTMAGVMKQVLPLNKVKTRGPLSVTAVGQRGSIVGRSPGNAMVVLPCTPRMMRPAMSDSNITVVKNTVIRNQAIGTADTKTVSLFTPVGTRVVRPSGVRVFLPTGGQNMAQVHPTKTVPLGANATKMVVMKSVGLSPNRPTAVLGKAGLGDKIQSPPTMSVIRAKQLNRNSIMTSMSDVPILRQPSTPLSVSSNVVATRSLPLACSSNVSFEAESSPVYLLVPSDSKGSAVNVVTSTADLTSATVQPAVKHLLVVPKTTKAVLPSQNTTLHVTPTKNLMNVTPAVKRAHGMTGSQSNIFVPTKSSVRPSNDIRTKTVSILRPQTSSNSSMTSLLKKASVCRPPFPSISRCSVPSQNEARRQVPSIRPTVTVTSISRCSVPSKPDPGSFIKTQVGNQTVFVKVGHGAKSNEPKIAVKHELSSKLNKLEPSTTAGSENQLPKDGTEKSLLIKSTREAQQKKPFENKANIELENFETMEDLMRSLVKLHPIVGSNADRSLYPYCAPSWNAFLQWNIGKRRAAELCRVIAVRKVLCSKLDGETTFRGERIWSKRKIINWCREHLYTPIDNEMKVAHMKEDDVDKRCPGEIYSSLTDQRDLADRLDIINSTSCSKQEDWDVAEDMEIDVVSIDDSPEKKKKVPKSPAKDMTGMEIIAPSPEAQFVHEMAQKIGIRLHPVAVCPDDSSHVLSSTVEEMIAAATKAFIEEIIRTSCSNLFKSGRNPLELTASGVYHAIGKMDRCNFLTNHSLGVQEDETKHD